KPNVFAIGGFDRLLIRGVNAFGDEVEDRAPVHDDRSAGMVSENENRRVVRRNIAPPALPRVVGPVSSDRPEHVSAHDPGPDVPKAGCGDLAVDPRRTAAAAMHLPEGTGGKGPLVQADSANPERIAEILIGAGTIAIDG